MKLWIVGECREKKERGGFCLEHQQELVLGGKVSLAMHFKKKTYGQRESEPPNQERENRSLHQVRGSLDVRLGC